MSFPSSRKYTSLALIVVVALGCCSSSSNAFAPQAFIPRTATTTSSAPSSALYGKKSARKGGGGGGKGGSKGQAPQEKQSVKDDRFDAMTSQFMFTIMKLSKILPDKSKTILKNINLSFYPGAKIGLVGLNGSGKSTLLKIMAGLDKEFEGTARPLPGASIGFLSQEPELAFATVKECVDDAVGSSRKILDDYNNLGLKLADPDITQDDMDKTMAAMETLNDQIEAGNLWDLDRVVERAMDSLRVPSGDSKTDVLSGGEKRRVALCRLLLANHDMLLLDEPTNHLDAESISWLEQFLADFKGTVVCISKLFCCWETQSVRGICFCICIHKHTHIPLTPSCLLLHNTLQYSNITQLTTATSWRMSLNGFWNSIVARVFHSRVTIPFGWNPKPNAWKAKKRLKLPHPELSRPNWNGFGPIPRLAPPRARLV